jgi:acyl-CoA dehydrogenase
MTTAPVRQSSAERAELRGLVLDVLGDLTGTAGTAEGSGHLAWQRLTASDLVLVSLQEEHGGSGGDLRDSATILSAVAEAGLSLPLVETTWLAGWLATTTGHDAPAGMASFAVGRELEVRTQDGTPHLSGVVRVPWGRQVDELHLVLPSAAGVAVIPSASTSAHLDAVGVPTDLLEIAVPLGPGQWRELPAPFDQVEREIQVRSALGRSIQIAGALRSALDLAVRYAGERVQFGRTLSQNQVIQHYLATVAGLVHGVTTATDAAVDAFLSDGQTASIPVLSAAGVASHAVEQATTLVHQVIGAIGTTREHPLHRRTINLWAWRDAGDDEFATAAALSDVLLTDDRDLWDSLVPLDGETEHEGMRR